MSIVQSATTSSHAALMKTWCSVEGEKFWRDTRFIGVSPIMKENMSKSFPRVKDIENVIANQKKNQFAYLKFSMEKSPNTSRYISLFPDSEPKFSVHDKPKPGSALISLSEEVHTHVEKLLVKTGGITPQYLFDKYSIKLISKPIFATLSEVKAHNKEALPESTIELSGMQIGFLKRNEKQIKLNKEWRRYHQTTFLPGERWTIGNGYYGYYTEKQHFFDGPITVPNTVGVPVSQEYMFYPFIYDEFDHLRNLNKSEDFIKMLNDSETNPSFFHEKLNKKVSAYIETMLSSGLAPNMDVSASDVLVKYITSFSPTVSNPFNVGEKLFAAQKLDAGSNISQDGVLVIRQNGVVTDIIYVIFVEQVFYHATHKSPSGRYAVKREDLFLEEHHTKDLAPRYVLNSMVGASEEQPHRITSKFLTFTPTEIPGQKLFENAEEIDENVTPLITKSSPKFIEDLGGITTTASLLTILRRECYSNPIAYGAGNLMSTTEALYGTVMVKGVFDMKIYIPH